MEKKEEQKALRSGFTTGACSAGAAKAATRCLLQESSFQESSLQEIETTLPNGNKVLFPLHRNERNGKKVLCSIIKDAGDDPDCTHGAELVAEVELQEKPGVELRGGEGVATVTRPGLGLEVGTPAINPVPRKNIREMVMEELEGSQYPGAIVTISVPGGEEMAKETLNARLGLVGGISILGTTGIVKPYSTSAFRASVVQSIDVAKEQGENELVLTTGGKSETYAMALLPELDEVAFIQVGDFIGTSLRRCAKVGIRRVNIVGMMGKLSKMADGKMMTHAAGSKVNMELLASLAQDLEGEEGLVSSIREANTARHVLELCEEAGMTGLPGAICKKVVEECNKHTERKEMEISCSLVDFGGNLQGQFPNN